MSVRSAQRFESRVFSVFIGNVPFRSSWRSLWAYLEKRVCVIDVYLSRKRDSSASRFAFVRFKSLDEASSCIRIFQNMMFLGNQLTLSHARDGDRRQYWKRVRRPAVSNIPSGASCESFPEKAPPVSRCLAIEDPVFVRGLNRSVVGYLSAKWSFAEVQSEICSKTDLDVVVRLLSDNAVLVEFNSYEKFVEEQSVNFRSLGNWLSDFRVWNDSFMAENRLVWLSISGLPLRFWGAQSFESIAKIWGELSLISEPTAKKLDLRSGFIQIKTGRLEKIDEVIDMCHCDSYFRVKVCEISGSKFRYEFGSGIFSDQQPSSVFSSEMVAVESGAKVGVVSSLSGCGSPYSREGEEPSMEGWISQQEIESAHCFVSPKRVCSEPLRELVVSNVVLGDIQISNEPVLNTNRVGELGNEAGGLMGWGYSDHVSMVDFGPSDVNLEVEGEIMLSNLEILDKSGRDFSVLDPECGTLVSSSRALPSSEKSCNLKILAGVNLKTSRCKKGSYGIFENNRVRAFAYARNPKKTRV